MKKYSDINVGDEETITHRLTRSDIDRFVELTGDDNKLHVDEKFSRQTSFKKPVVHGMLGASFISTVIGTKLPGDGALWYSQSLEFLIPARIDDVLTIVAEVIKKYDKERIIELKTEIYNQNRQLITRGFAKVKVIEIESGAIKDDQVNETRKKTALVIGGTGGIGSATCIQLAKDGFNIIINYNSNNNKAEKIKSEINKLQSNAICLKCDISNENEINDLIEKSYRAFNSVDVLVNCAATPIPNIKFSNLIWADFLSQIDLNIRSIFLIMKEILPRMILTGSGKIINIGSIAAEKPNSDWVHYITAKAALVGLTRSLAFEFAPKGIQINMVTPSLVDTVLTSDIPEKVKLLTAAQTPLRRLATPQDVAGVISFLASPKSNFLTGENIRVNGGQLML